MRACVRLTREIFAQAPFSIPIAGKPCNPPPMLAEKAADHILGRTPLAPSNADDDVAKGWDRAQR